MDKLVQEGRVIIDEDDIININHEVTCDTIVIINEEGCICHTFVKPNGGKKGGELSVLSTRCLFKATYRFFEFTYVVRELGGGCNP